MYAIIATGGKQYKVAEGDIIRVEKLGAEDGAEVTFDDVIAVQNDTELLFGDAVKNAAVKASVVKTDKAKKVVVYRYKRKSGYHKKNGHRQPYTEVKIESINA
ncbi:MAG: 50S ribosomal protein L21 [Eubacterium sp.]|nr:50S ribosomal protein L21 [Eubacterium sp.]